MKVSYLFSDEKIAKIEHPEDDWKVWTVINPAKWMVPWFIVLMVQMWMIHTYALALPGYGWKDAAAEAYAVKHPAVMVAPAPVAQ